MHAQDGTVITQAKLMIQINSLTYFLNLWQGEVELGLSVPEELVSCDYSSSTTASPLVMGNCKKAELKFAGATHAVSGGQ